MKTKIHYLAKTKEGMRTICTVGRRLDSNYQARVWTDNKAEVTCERCLNLIKGLRT